MKNYGISIKGVLSSIKGNINSMGHPASLENCGILDKANNNFTLLIHESLLILRDLPALNFQNSTLPLHLL